MTNLTDLSVYSCTDNVYFPYMSTSVSNNIENEQDFSAMIEDIAKNKNKDAFIKLFNHFAPRIKSFARKSGFSSNEAEDLSQETLITVWNKAKLFDSSKSAASTWVFTIGRNKRIDHLRRQKHPLPSQDDLISNNVENTYEVSMEKEQLFTMMKSEIKNLPIEQSDVLKKSFFEGKSHIEISKDLSIPLGTVKSRIRLAITSIRKKMKDFH